MYDFRLLIKKLQISTSLGENENKSKLNAEGIKLPPKGTLVKGQSALYWLWAANQTMGENHKEEVALYSNPQMGLLKILQPLQRKWTVAIIGGKASAPAFKGVEDCYEEWKFGIRVGLMM